MLTHTILAQQLLESTIGAVVGHLDNSHPTATSFLIVALFPHFSCRVAAAVMSIRLNHTTLLRYTLPLALGQAGFNSFSRQATRFHEEPKQEEKPTQSMPFSDLKHHNQ